MNRHRKRNHGRKSVQNLLGLQGFTNYGLKTTGGELVYFAIQPINISVLSPANIENKIKKLHVVLNSHPRLEVICMDSAQRFDNNQLFIDQRILQENNPQVQLALKKDREFLSSIQLEMATARQFVLCLRFKNQKDSQVFATMNQAEKAISDRGFEVRRLGKEDVKRLLAIYFEATMNGDRIPDVEGSENFDLEKARSVTL